MPSGQSHRKPQTQTIHHLPRCSKTRCSRFLSSHDYANGKAQCSKCRASSLKCARKRRQKVTVGSASGAEVQPLVDGSDTVSLGTTDTEDGTSSLAMTQSSTPSSYLTSVLGPNDGLWWDNILLDLSSTDVGRFRNGADLLTSVLRDPQVYTKLAREKIIELLSISRVTLRQAQLTYTDDDSERQNMINDFTIGSLNKAFCRLVATVGCRYRLFVEANLAERLRDHIAAALFYECPGPLKGEDVIYSWLMSSGEEVPVDTSRFVACMVQSTLDHSLGDDHCNRPLWIRTLLELCHEQSGDTLSSLFIHGVVEDAQESYFAKGHFGHVSRGTYRGRYVALKRLRDHTLTHPETPKFCWRLYREALQWRQLRHPLIVPLIGIDFVAWGGGQGHLCLVSPWMPQGTLEGYLKRSLAVTGGPIDHNTLIMDIATGLSYVHGQLLAHGDLHSSNIFINGEHRALLGDFGLTASADPFHLSPTTSINKAGALRWLAPELIPSDTCLAPRKTMSGDVFAFGRVCLTIYTRQEPYASIRTDVTILLTVLKHEHPPRPKVEETHGYHMPAKFWQFLLNCWLPEAENRPNMAIALATLDKIFA